MSLESVASIVTPASATALMAGFVFGLAYFAALHRTAVLIAAHRGWLLPSALTLGRMAALAAALGLAARFGAAPLLSMFVGFVLARALALRFVRGGD